jgi:16S rRNA (cytidine1402-2'-O)-methyltransferase
MGTLYLVATPIGNLEDMSPRAVRTLGEVGLIAAEDTRVTRKLLAHFGMHTPLTSYFEHNKLAKLGQVLQALAQGQVALVSDAGTPGVNDPGYELVRAALEAGHTVVPIPGPSAPMVALSASGLPSDAFLFLGYLPRKASTRRDALEKVASLPYTLIFLEAPHRILPALDDLLRCLGDRKTAVARELTKLHEQIWRGKLSDAAVHFRQHEPRGEFTLVVAGAPIGQGEEWAEATVRQAVLAGLKAGGSPAEVARGVAKESGWERRQVYRLVSGQDDKGSKKLKNT